MTTNRTTPPGMHPEAMLEPERTCGDCAHLRRCTALGFTKRENSWCDFIPIRFRAAARPSADSQPGAAVEGSDGETR